MTTSPLVPSRLHVAINGRPYMIDHASQQFRGPWTTPVARTQSDTSGKAGESSLARENLWRRTQTSWHHGCGQPVYDDETGDPYRFRKSLGVDVWTAGQLKPLGGLKRVAIPAANGGNIASPVPNQIIGGQFGQVSSGASLYNCWDPTSGIVTYPANILSLCSDGATIYAALAGAGTLGGGAIYSGTAPTLYTAAGTAYLVRYALGRLWVATDAGLFNQTAPGASTAVANPSATWRWTDVVAGNGAALASGYDQTSSSHSSIWHVGILPDGSGVDGGFPIAEMPNGEVIYSLHAYLGYIIVGTNRGVRVCQHGGGSNFTVGPLLDLFSAAANNGNQKAPSTTGVRCFASFERFVYFGWSFYDWGGQINGFENSGTYYAGLGRMDLSTMLAPLQPAFATDVMRKVTASVGGSGASLVGEVTSCHIDKFGTPSFVVHSKEFYFGQIGGTPQRTSAAFNTSEDPYLWSGRVLLGIDDKKVPARLRVRTDTGVGGNNATVAVVTEAGVSTSMFTTTTGAGGTEADLAAIGPTESLEVRMTWPSLAAIANLEQIIYDIRIDAWPSPRRVQRWQLPLLLAKTVNTLDDMPYTYDSLKAELDALLALAAPSGRIIVQAQIGSATYNVVVDEVDFRPTHQVVADAPASLSEWAGTCLVTLSAGLD